MAIRDAEIRAAIASLRTAPSNIGSAYATFGEKLDSQITEVIKLRTEIDKSKTTFLNLAAKTLKALP